MSGLSRPLHGLDQRTNANSRSETRLITSRPKQTSERSLWRNDGDEVSISAPGDRCKELVGTH